MSPLPGVTDITINADEKTATCAIEGEDFDSAKAVEALVAAEFPDASLVQ